MSEELKTVYELFADIKREVGPVGKDSRNQQQGFNFRGIDAVVNAAAPALDRHGVITVPVLESIEYATVEVGKARTPMAHVRVRVTYRFTGPRGDWFDATVPGEAMDSGDKATPKAMTVAYRIALLQALNLPTGEADPDSQTYERSPRGAEATDLSGWEARIAAASGPGDLHLIGKDAHRMFSDGSLTGADAGRIKAMLDGNASQFRQPRNQGPREGQKAATGGNDRVSRPAQPQPSGQDAAQDPAEADEGAQEYATQAQQARALSDLEAIHERAKEAGKLTAFIRSPSSGGIGKLALYIDWRRKQLADVDKALKELDDAAQFAQIEIGDVEIHVRKVTGVSLEDAAAAQIRQAARALWKRDKAAP